MFNANEIKTEIIEWIQNFFKENGSGCKAVVGDFSPLSNLTVAEVKEVGYALGIPKEFIEKIPSDGLCDKTDEDNLGFTYEVLDKYIRTGVIEDVQLKNKIDQMHEKNLFKLQMMPSFSFDMRRDK